MEGERHRRGMTTPEESSLLARRRARLAENAGSASYGAIVVAAVIASVSHHEERAGVILGTACSTIVVFFCAHVYAAAMTRRFAEPTETPGKSLGHVLVHERPMLEIALAPIAILFASWLGWMQVDHAVTAALWITMLELFAFGFHLGRKLERSAGYSLATGLLYATAGALVIGLKILIH
jgi:hypothetical protein